MNIVNKQLQFSEITLEEPLKTGFILIALEIDKRTSFLGESPNKRSIVKYCKEQCSQLENDENVIEAIVFKASLFPSGRDGEFLKNHKKKNEVHTRYDIVILIELKSFDVISIIETQENYVNIVKEVSQHARYCFITKAKNTRRIGSVDHKKKGVFLFNFFFAESTEQNIKIWEHTAGWFQKETGLNNSTLLLPSNEEKSQHSVINHCRWDGFMNILPLFIFNKTFKTFVLANFEANNVATIPILYKLA